jgi:Phytanoyl-CoA dioxygenase (PhyH)
MMTRDGLIKDPFACYEEHGFAILGAYSNNESEMIIEYATNWLQSLLPIEQHQPLESYHLWFKHKKIEHNSLFAAKNRHRKPDQTIEKIIMSERIESFLNNLVPQGYTIWDEGLGWLAFRFIRPRHNDGYPFSCKAWGPAKTVISAWLPVIGLDSNCTLKMLPGSHKLDYERHLPENSKFCKDEYRLNKLPAATEVYQPELKPGDIIFFHPNLLHSEDVTTGNNTRLSLEFRILTSEMK